MKTLAITKHGRKPRCVADRDAQLAEGHSQGNGMHNWIPNQWSRPNLTPNISHVITNFRLEIYHIMLCTIPPYRHNQSLKQNTKTHTSLYLFMHSGQRRTVVARHSVQAQLTPSRCCWQLVHTSVNGVTAAVDSSLMDGLGAMVLTKLSSSSS